MGNSFRRRRRQSALLALVVVAGLVAAAAVAATRATDPKVLAAAKVAAKKYTTIPTKWPGPFSSPRAARGKTIMILSCSQATACATEAAGAVEAAKVLGWETGEVVDGKGDPNVMSTAIRNAVTRKVDGIMLAGTIPTLAIRSALKFAKDHGVPVQNNFDAPPAARGFPKGDPLITAENPAPNGQEGTAMANWLIADSNGKAQIVLFTDDEFASLKFRTANLVKQFKKCSGCKLLDLINLPVATVVSSKMASQVQSALDRFGKNVQYVILPYSAADAFAIQALKTRRRQDVKLVSWSPQEQQIKYCHDGLLAAANVEGSLAWDGWMGIDQLNRVFQGRPAPPHPTPYFLITPKTCPGSGGPDDLLSKINFRAEFKKLWKVNK